MSRIKEFMIIFIALVVMNSASAKDLMFDLCVDNVTTAQFQYYSQRFQDFAMWVFWTQIGIEHISLQKFQNAKNAGLNMQIVFTPCRAKSPQSQVNDLIKNFGTNTTIWINPNNFTTKQCDWSQYTAADNCDYLKRILDTLKASNLKTGVCTSRALWKRHLGSQTECHQVSKYPLVWVPLQNQQDGLPYFEDYTQIGGWVQPYMKFYQVEEVCGSLLIKIYHR